MSVVVADPQNSTLVLNGHVFRDFAEGEKIVLSRPNPLTSRKNSESGGVTIIKAFDGDVGSIVIKIQKNSDDDIFMNTALSGDTTVLNGSLKTRLTRDTVDGVASYTLVNGSITEQPTDTIENKEANDEMEYTIEFRTVTRNL